MYKIKLDFKDVYELIELIEFEERDTLFNKENHKNEENILNIKLKLHKENIIDNFKLIVYLYLMFNSNNICKPIKNMSIYYFILTYPT